MRVVALAGGTGGAKLAAGLQDAVGADLTVIANTADDIEIYGVHVSPDPDLVSYWLAGTIDDRGWGIRDDSFTVMDALAAAGREPWFRLGDRDLAMCMLRTELLRTGAPLTRAHRAVVDGLGVAATVLPMCDDPVRTEVRSGGRLRPLQQFLIVDGADAPVEGVELGGIEAARPAPAVLDALAAADAIVIGPSNPVISIGPILAVPGMREAIAAAAVPVVAVSPFVGGQVLKGPTGAFMASAGLEPGAAGVARAYEGLIHGIVCDEPMAVLPALQTDTLLSTPEQRRRVADETLAFAQALGV